MLWSKIPSSGPCQSHLEENSLCYDVGNGFTQGETHCRHSTENDLKAFITSTVIILMCIVYV